MKKYFFVLLLSIFFGIAEAQRNEIGITVGGSYYLGDINPSGQFVQTKPAAGLVYRYVFNPRWALKFDGIYGTVEGSDAESKFDEKRNLSFKSYITEVSTQLELNFLPYITGDKDAYVTPYIFAGLSLFSFNPKAEYDGTWYDLQPLGTEGQGTSKYYDRKPYSLTKLAFPFGLGFKYSIGKVFCVGAEWGMRKTTTDYLDDISTTYADPTVLAAENTPIAALLADRTITETGQTEDHTDLQRGNSSTKDWYSYAGIILTVKFKTGGSKSCPAYNQHNKHSGFNKD